MLLKLKRLTILILVLFIQFQPVHVHAVELKSQQSGHPAGTLYHSHQQSDSVQSGSGLHEETSNDSTHNYECHPGHVLSPAIDGIRVALTHSSILSPEPSYHFVSITLSLEPPPPRRS